MSLAFRNQAYLAAFNGKYATANTWISRGNAQIVKANKEIVTVDANAATIGRDMTALVERLAQNGVRCGSQ